MIYSLIIMRSTMREIKIIKKTFSCYKNSSTATGITQSTVQNAN